MINIKRICLLTLGAILTMSSMITYVANASTETITNNRAKQFVDIVTEQKNKPYQYGATGPSCFDCSGLIYYATGQMPSLKIDGQDVKINLENGLGRSTNDQYNAEKGHYVSIYDRRPGDIVFFGGSSYNVTHEGMYLQGDTFIHAPRTNEVVKETSLSSRSNLLSSVRRLEGWLQSSNSWKFLVADTEVNNKWVLDNNSYYYINNSGYMEESGWQWIDGSCYKFNPSGIMESDNWLWDNGKCYYVKPSGAMDRNNWVQYKDIWYYVGNDGAMIVNDWVKWKDIWYHVGSDGAMQKGWLTINGKQYYFHNDGSMAKNTVIDGKTIGSDGAVK